VQQAKEALAEQESHLETLQESLHASLEFRHQVQAQVQAGQEEVAQQRASLADIERQLSRMDEVQTWVEAHQTEYNIRMGRLNQYIQTASAEYHKLKAAIDSGFIHRYLRDLRALSESYEFELTQAQQLETNIDQRLEEAKRDLSALITQAREVADSQEQTMANSAPKPIDSVEFDEGRERAVQNLQDHQTERHQIRELIRRTLNDEEDPRTAEEEAAGAVSQAAETPRLGTLTPRAPARKRGRPAKNASKKR
jgi:chromosome segregation ATPase